MTSFVHSNIEWHKLFTAVKQTNVCCYITSCQSSLKHFCLITQFLCIYITQMSLHRPPSLVWFLPFHFVSSFVKCVYLNISFKTHSTWHHYLTNNKLAQWNEIECCCCLLFSSSIYECVRHVIHYSDVKSATFVRVQANEPLFIQNHFSFCSLTALWWMLCTIFFMN